MKLKFPSSYTLLLGLIVLMAALSWAVPVGRFDRVMDARLDREVPVAGSFKFTESTPQGLGDIALAPISGFYDAKSYKANAIDIALFVLLVGGFIGVVNKAGLFQALVSRLTGRLEGREIWMIPAMMSFFGIVGTTGAMYEESLTLFGIVVPIFLVAGFDRLTAVAVIFLGINVGVVASTVNPFTTIIASNAAQTPFVNGLLPRVAVLVIGLLFASAYVMRYARRVKSDPAASLVDVADNAHYSVAGANEAPALTGRLWLILAVFVGAYVVMFAGVMKLGWWMPQMSAVFLVAAIIVGLIARFSENQIIDYFMAGAGELLGVALIIGVARGVVVIMDASQMTDTVLYAASKMLEGVPTIGFINLMYWVQFLIGFLVPSSSGAAVLTMPIMAPLGDLAGVDRGLVVSAYQYANGMMNIITPTNATLIGSLMLGRVGIGAWFKFIWPLMVFMTVLLMATLSLGAMA